MQDKEGNLAARVRGLGVGNPEGIKRVVLSVSSSFEIPNKPGSSLSAQILAHIRRKHGVLNTFSAKEALDIYGNELRQDARENPGKHPTIDLLEDVASGTTKGLNIDVVRHPEMEVLPAEKAEAIRKAASFADGTPFYCYFEADMQKGMQELLSLPAPFGLVVRYAVKANTSSAILRIFENIGAHFDSSSANESLRIMEAGKVKGKKIRQTSQEVVPVSTLHYLIEKGVKYTACSLLQLENYGKEFPGTSIAVRFNVGIGSGWTAATSTGGKAASFGIYGQTEELEALLEKYNLTLDTVHLHIGSGSDPEKQKQAALKGIEIAERYPTVTNLNLGGGFKVARMKYEKAADLSDVGKAAVDAILDFKKRTGRDLVLEIEPGTAAVANAGYIVGSIMDIVTTGPDGYTFLKLDTGMTENSRIPMYGAQHPVFILPQDGERGIADYVVVGPCCESGDVLTVRPGEPGAIDERRLAEAKVGDLVVIGGAGAYCESMCSPQYNSRGAAPELLVRSNGNIDIIRRTPPIDELWGYEVIPEDLMPKE